MNKTSLPHSALLRSFLASLLLASTALAITPAEIEALRAKAANGNAIAQYNLGLAHADRNSPAYDPVEAYVWLNIAAENGATGKALETITASLSPSQIADGRNRLAARHAASATAPSDASSNPIMGGDSPIASAPATAASSPQSDADKKQLSEELASSWKETERVKASLNAQLADANKRLAIAESALANKEKEITALQNRPAPAPAAPANTAELDSLRASAAKAEFDRAVLLAKLNQTTASLAAAQSAQRQAEAEAASLKSSADKAGAERLAFAAQLESANSETARLRSELDAAKSAASAESPAVAELRTKFNAAQTELTSLKSATGGLSTTGVAVLKADRDHLAESLAQLTKERDDLAQQLTAAKAAVVPAAPADPSAPDVETLTARLATAEKTKAALEAKLDSALRTYTVNQTEIDQLQKALANIDGERAANADKLDAARKELASLRPQAEANAASAAQVVTLGNQLADTQSKLAERTSALDQAVRDLASVRQVADTLTTDLASTREQLRQTQAQAAANANEALNLKTRLALAGSVPTAPSRPGAITPTAVAVDNKPLFTAPAATSTPPPASAPAKVEAPAASPQPRTYTVSPGDSLYSIAKHCYGSAGRWPEILAANRDVITNPNALSLGTTLRIP